jgi:hypothetical protein
MFAQHVYPDIEYRIRRIIDPRTDKEVFFSQPDADYEKKPIYSLLPQLEWQWRVRIKEKDIPLTASSSKSSTPHLFNCIDPVPPPC